MIRLVLCWDFDTDNPKEAYAAMMATLDTAKFHELSSGYETSDEWYRGEGEDLDNPADVHVLNTAIDSYYKNKHAESKVNKDA